MGNKNSCLSAQNNEPAADDISSSSSPSTNPATLFTSNEPDLKRGSSLLADSLINSGILENLINPFLDLKGTLSLTQINKKLYKSTLLKRAVEKQLLITLVGAYQEPHPKYTPEEAQFLLKGCLKLFENNPVEYQLALAVSLKPGEEKKAEEEKEGLPKDFIKAFEEPRKQALAKALLLELIRAHQYPKTQALINKFPPFLSSTEDQMDYLLALMVSGSQNQAEAFIKENPELLEQKGRVLDQDGKTYKDITPYQYTLCLKHTQMRLMIRNYLPNESAALQAKEFEAPTNHDMKALEKKYVDLMQKTQEAYQFFIAKDKDKDDSWKYQQYVNYWCRAIGGLQGEWAVHWMQEFFYPREFNGQTEFNSEEALKALPEAKYLDGEPFYPADQGYMGTKLALKSYPPNAEIDVEELPQDLLLLIQKGNRYFIYGPRLSSDLKKEVAWELKELDAKIVANALSALPFSKPPAGGVSYSPLLRPLYALVDRALVCRGVGSGFSFRFSVVNWRVGASGGGVFRGDFGPARAAVSLNLAGLSRLNVVRTEERNSELVRVRQHLPKSEDKAASALDFPLSPFRRS